jgi:hypothetical protein
MIRGRYRWPIRIAILLIAGLGLLVWAITERSRNRLALENRSGQPIASLEVTVAKPTDLKKTVAKQTHTFEDVRPGAEVAAPFPIKPGDHFAFKGVLADGTRIGISGVVQEQSRFVAVPGGQIIPRPSGKAGR